MGGQCSVRTSTIVGVEALPVDVEVDVGAGLPGFTVVGLPDLAVQEARERVRSALRRCGFELPSARIVVNLAPATLRKHGTGFDLPIAMGILGATGQLPSAPWRGALTVGELSLDGTVRRVPGLLSHGLAARSAGLALIGPADDPAPHHVEGLVFLPLCHLSGLRGAMTPSSGRGGGSANVCDPELDFADVVGQERAVRALTAAAAGGHNVLLVGPPGSGKTMLARRLPTILPPLAPSEALETAVVHSVAGLSGQRVFSGRRPFRAPHHSATVAGLVGGGSPPHPGEASLAHNGVLFLDEMPEFGPAALQCLRQPLEDGAITLVRAEGRITFPTRFALVGAANLCPCGFLGDPARPCTCAPHMVDRYLSRIGGPLIDRIDLVVEVPRPKPDLLMSGSRGVASEQLSKQVAKARARAAQRGTAATSRLGGTELLAACRLDDEATRFTERAATAHHLSGRGLTRLLRVARTFADLEGRDHVRTEDLSEGLGYRFRGGR